MKFRFVCLLLMVTSALSAAPLSGTKSIGPSGDYVSITTALANIQSQTLAGPLLLELQPAYLSTVETFPLVFTNLTTTAVNTLTIRPQTGAVGLVISSADTTAATVDLNNAQYITFDGRPGGLGTAKQLTIANTSTSGRALRFINEASTNTIKFLTLRGVNTSATSGTVFFSTTIGANGNDNNTIDTCDLRDGATTPVNALYSLGTTTTTAQNNSGNTVSNCNVFNFYAATALDAAGVRLDDGNTDWTLAGNSFYQTASRASVAANVRAIYINNISGNNFAVTGNFIGGTAANAGGSAWTTTGTTVAYRFVGIHLNVGTTVANNTQGNTIRNMVWTSSSTAGAIPGVWGGVYVQAGLVNAGTVAGNTIGSGTGTGSVSVTTSGSGGTIYGVCSPTGVATSVVNNTIGSITANGSTSSISSSIIGISIGVLLNSVTVSNNTIGSTSTPNSLNAATSSTSATGQEVTGILSGGNSGGTLIITGNTVANLNNNYVGTAAAGQVRGIVTTEGQATISGNTVRNLSTASNNTGTTFNASVLGIALYVTAGNLTLSHNVVHSLSNSWNVGGVVMGIYYAGAVGGNNLIAGNLVHSLSGVELRGMEFGNGGFTAQNNMVRVGIDASGNTAGTSFISGITDSGTTAGRKLYHNSVYVGGTPTSGSASTYAFGSTGTTNVRDFRNNVFVNARSNSGATSKHYAVIYGGTAVNPVGLTAGSNILHVTGTGGVLGLYNTVDRTTLAGWQSATGQDASSATINPMFINPTGTSATVNLHLQAVNPAEGGGVPLAAVIDDFDGEVRSNLTPVDIGADAGNFTSSSGDIYAPVVSYVPLSNGSTANRTLSDWASVVDNSGIVAGGANAPRLYYKRSNDADVFGGNTSSDNGWKYVTASNSASPYSFTVDYSIINGGSVATGDTIQYFVAAQDTANNLASGLTAATASTSPPVQNINGKPGAGVNSYGVVTSLNGTVTVGPGGTYTTLSGFGGLFSALNSGVLTSNLTVNLTGNTIEDGSNALNAFSVNNYPPSASTFTVTIQPDSATMRTMAGSNATGLVQIKGAQRLTIDGSLGGSGRYLTFRNTSTTGPTILFTNDASNNTIRNCIIEGAVNTSTVGVVRFAAGVATGNDNNIVTGNQIRDRSDAVGVPYALVSSFGSSNTVANSNNTISNNELFNFTDYGVAVFSGSDSWNITGNTIYQTAVRTFTLYGIYFNGLGTNSIRGNTIRDLTTPSTAYGIYLDNQTGNTTVAGNRAWNLGNTAASTGYVAGIALVPGTGHSVTVINNMIALNSTGSTAQTLRGIYEQGSAGSTCVTAFNTVLITGTGSAGKDTWAFTRGFGSSNATVKNNVFLNLRTGGGNHFAANHLPGSTGPLAMDNNVYSGTGLTTAANLFDSSNGFSVTGTPISYSQWKTNVPTDTLSSAGIAGTGNFTSAMFVDPATADLHLVPAGSPLVANNGTPFAGLTTDFDGQTRAVVAPDIGADEYDFANANLSALTLSAGTLDPAFDTNTLAYTATVSNAISAMTVTPIKADPNATSSITGGGLAIGPNTLTVLVTAQDGTTKTYALTVTRQTAFQTWAALNNVTADPSASGSNGLSNVLNFGFSLPPGGSGGLVYNGTFAGGGSIAATGLPITRIEGTDARVLFVRRNDFSPAGLVYTPQFSADLSSWADGTDAATILADDGLNQVVSVPYPALIGGQAVRFVRISVSFTP